MINFMSFDNVKKTQNHAEIVATASWARLKAVCPSIPNPMKDTDISEDQAYINDRIIAKQYRFYHEYSQFLQYGCELNSAFFSFLQAIKPIDNDLLQLIIDSVRDAKTLARLEKFAQNKLIIDNEERLKSYELLMDNILFLKKYCAQGLSIIQPIREYANTASYSPFFMINVDNDAFDQYKNVWDITVHKKPLNDQQVPFWFLNQNVHSNADVKSIIYDIYGIPPLTSENDANLIILNKITNSMRHIFEKQPKPISIENALKCQCKKNNLDYDQVYDLYTMV